MSKQKIILHCSDSTFGNAAEITKWHVVDNGWSTIGYHYVILNGKLSPKSNNKYFDGHIETGRPLDDDNTIEPMEIGAHTRGHNDAVGICLIGESGEFSAAQIISLYQLLCQLEKQFEEIEIFQHSDFEPKKQYCAGLNMDKVRKFYKNYHGK